MRGTLTQRQRLRRFGAAVSMVGALALAYGLLPEPGPRLRPMPMSGETLRAQVRRFVAPPPRLPRSDAERAMVELGRVLFHDRGLSRHGAISCSHCHDQAKAFTDGLAVSHGLAVTSKNAPSLANGYLQHWFFWDGRADSLAAQALQEVEDPRGHGFSRVGVARRLKARHAQEYERAFGAFPVALDLASLPEHALPPRQEAQLSIDVAAKALASLGSFDLLTDIMQKAHMARTAPATELTQRALGGPPVEASWTEAWATLTPAQRGAVDQVFANFGRAVAAFEAGLVATDSPFDRYAARLFALPPERPDSEALDLSFDRAALDGFKLFAGPARCALCHDGPAFSDQQFHNTGLAQRGMALDVGRAAGVVRAVADPFNCLGMMAPAPPVFLGEGWAGVGPPQERAIAFGTGRRESCLELPFLDAENEALIGAFKTPSLRNVAATAPYMHDGRYATLDEVLQFYDGLEERAALGHREDTLAPLELTAEEKAALGRFLESLASPVTDANRPKIAVLDVKSGG